MGQQYTKHVTLLIHLILTSNLWNRYSYPFWELERIFQVFENNSYLLQLSSRFSMKQKKAPMIIHSVFYPLLFVNLVCTSVTTLKNNLFACISHYSVFDPWFFFSPKCLRCSRYLVNGDSFYFFSGLILLLSFMASLWSCFFHIKCSLTVSTCKISVLDWDLSQKIFIFSL